MANVYSADQIRAAVDEIDVTPLIEEGFVAYSEGRVVVPPVGELTFEDPPGDTHIKYGYIRGDDAFVIKIASGFYANPTLGLPSSSGLMLLFSQQTGQLRAVLLDEGFLTNVRTAVAGRIAARYLAPAEVSAIGVLGTGTMARMQVAYLASETGCRDVVVWGRSDASLERYQRDMEALGYHVTPTREASAVGAACNLIVTTTPATVPLLRACDVRPGTHITAVGSDTAEKQELDAEILRAADVVVADSIVQCRDRGEIHHAVAAGALDLSTVRELGEVIKAGRRARESDSAITVADLTGVAVQDIQIAKAVHRRLCAPG
ncbi:MAG: ornithine cyclodeaminase family protein [Ectothiorhodospiraceae bacterium]|nr:ornithine cyclodeaminase family protein [Ectothiorhodospiraceae bacterium]